MEPGASRGLGASLAAVLAAIVVAGAVWAMVAASGGLHRPLQVAPDELALAHHAPRQG